MENLTILEKGKLVGLHIVSQNEKHFDDISDSIKKNAQEIAKQYNEEFNSEHMLMASIGRISLIQTQLEYTMGEFSKAQEDIEKLKEEISHLGPETRSL